MPMRCPIPYVAAAAAPPSTSWRLPLHHQRRRVNREVSAPATNSPTPPTTSAGHRFVEPEQVGQQRDQRADREADERRDGGRPRARLRRPGRRPAPPARARAAPPPGWSATAGDLPGQVRRQAALDPALRQFLGLRLRMALELAALLGDLAARPARSASGRWCTRRAPSRSRRRPGRRCRSGR